MKLTVRKHSSRASRWRASRRSSACPAAPSCRSTTRSSTRRSATSSCATSRAPATWPRATPTRPAGPGVAMVTSGPGRHQHRHPAVRRLHGLDPDGGHHRPGGDRRRIGTDAFQECDTTGITMAGHQAQLPGHRGPGHPPHRPRGVPHRHDRAARARCSSTSPRTSSTPEPESAMDWYWPDDRSTCPATTRRPTAIPRMIREAAALILAAERPVIYAGGGILKARAAEALRELAELMRHPRGHDADGPRRVPRRPSARASGMPGHARQLHGGHRRCSSPTC